MKIQKKKSGGGRGRGGSDQELGWGRLGLVGDVGYGGCKPRIKGIDKCK